MFPGPQHYRPQMFLDSLTGSRQSAAAAASTSAALVSSTNSHYDTSTHAASSLHESRVIAGGGGGGGRGTQTISDIISLDWAAATSYIKFTAVSELKIFLWHTNSFHKCHQGASLPGLLTPNLQISSQQQHSMTRNRAVPPPAGRYSSGEPGFLCSAMWLFFSTQQFSAPLVLRIPAGCSAIHTMTHRGVLGICQNCEEFKNRKQRCRLAAGFSNRKWLLGDDSTVFKNCLLLLLFFKEPPKKEQGFSVKWFVS